MFRGMFRSAGLLTNMYCIGVFIGGVKHAPSHEFLRRHVWKQPYSLCALNKIGSFIEDSPDKMVVATGDIQQLQRLEILTNCQNPAIYIYICVDSCLDTIFKHNIFLTVGKGVGAKDSEEGDKKSATVNQLYEDF